MDLYTTFGVKIFPLSMKSLITASLLVSAAILLNTKEANAQVGIGTTSPHGSAALEISSTNKGLLIPRVTLANRPSAASATAGLLIYQTDNTPGLYLFNGSAWVAVSGGSAQTPVVLTTRAMSTYVAASPALGPYFFSPVNYQSPQANIHQDNTASASGNGTTSRTGYVIPKACTFTTLRLAARVVPEGDAIGSNNTTTITLYKNGVATALTVQVTNGVTVGASGANVGTGSVAVAAGDIISYEYKQTNQNPYNSYTIVLEGQ